MSEHTLTPSWKIISEEHSQIDADGITYSVAKEHLHLIAVAPKLLSICQELEAHLQVPEHLRGKPDEHNKAGLEIRARMNAIVLEATGGSR